MAEERETSPKSSFLARRSRGEKKPKEFRLWLNENWAPLLMLVLIFLLALFVRSYFAVPLAVDNGYLVSGGSDSYYWQRIIDYSMETGKQLYWDPAINFPDGLRNPRPPFFSMSVVVPATMFEDVFPSSDDAWGWFLIWSTAFWGAVTVIPTYFLGKETFGRRAGLVAAFLLAVMPSHVQRSVASEADHDAIILFFIVLTFYFLLKAVKAQDHRRWVENWRNFKSVTAGLKTYFGSSGTAILYALLAGTAFGTLIMIWVGFAYVTVLILAYYLIQILLNKFKGIDSMSVTFLLTIALGFGYLISFPVYYEQDLISVRFDVPVYLFLGAMAFGMLFVISRDLPWTITLPAIGVILVVGVAVISVLSPALGEAIMSGQGYFVKSKLYSTIAEARAPIFSELALSFGIVTFFLSLIGLFWALFKVPKHATVDYIFIVVWLGAAIFMAISAGRFMFNAAPAFAISAAWVIVMIVDRLDFNNVRKTIMGASGSYVQVLKKSIKVRHVVGVLFLAFMVVLPNVWYGVDAGIPQETKREYDRQIYESLPSIMRQSGYDAINGSNWYLGAFGYSIPLPKYYFPTAWEWFSEQDADVFPETAKPAYVSWWDYGFEAVQAGEHPTVADNFQNGYQIAGNIIMSQSEAEAIALFAYRLIHSSYNDKGEVWTAVQALMHDYDIDTTRINETLSGPGQPLIDEVLADPVTYGPMASDLSDTNARIVVARVTLTKLSLDKLVAFYDDLCDLTGWSIRYFNVDSRMFPSSGSSTGIFYAPAKLSDRRIEGGSIPVDFYVIKAQLQGGSLVDLDDLKATDMVTSYEIVYQDMFYDSMFYRAMVGYSGSDLGRSNDGIPGVSGSYAGSAPSPGWNMSHFRMVYRTAYYNPYPSSEIPYHPGAWRAVSLEEALALKQQIQEGSAQGVVDDSGSSFYMAGTVFLKYYAGAYVNGTITSDGYPVANIRATISDEYGVPHGTVLTDAEGKYSLLAPFGNVTLTLSTGDAHAISLTGTNTITTMAFSISDEAAMRKPVDRDMDGVYDYMITKDYEMIGSEVLADIFWDNNGDGNYTSGKDQLVQGLLIWAHNLETGVYEAIDTPDGAMEEFLPPGKYDFNVVVNGVNMTIGSSVNVTAGAKSSLKLPIPPGSLEGVLLTPDGEPAAAVELTLTNMHVDHVYSTVTENNGNFSFEKVVGGTYDLRTTEDGMVLFGMEVVVAGGGMSTANVTMFPASTITCRVVVDGRPVPYASYIITNLYNPYLMDTGTADAGGYITIDVPKDEWTVYASWYDGTTRYAGAVLADTRDSEAVSRSISVEEATSVTASLRNPRGSTVKDSYVTFELVNGARVFAKTDSRGTLGVVLPEGAYNVTASSGADQGIYSKNLAIYGDEIAFQLRMEDAVSISGIIFTDRNVGLSEMLSDVGRYVNIRVVDVNGRLFTTQSTVNGKYAFVAARYSTVTVTLGDLAYSDWSLTGSYAMDSSVTDIVAVPDPVTVTGRFTCEGVGVRGVTISLLPYVLSMDPIYVVTGAEGRYSALVPASEYRLVVADDTTPMGGERYIYEAAVAILPSHDPQVEDVDAVKKVEMYGFILGAVSDVRLKLEGPESVDLSLPGFNYSVWVLPGRYDAYASGYFDSTVYANISVTYVTATDRRFDFGLVQSHKVSGTVSISGGASVSPVDVTATTSGGVSVRTESSSTGEYSFDLPPGSYSLSFLLEYMVLDANTQLYVEYFYDTSVTVSSGAIDIDAALSMRLDNTTFSGVVYGADGVPKQAYVQLNPNGVYGVAKSYLTSSSGAFNISVQPGDYTMYVTRLDDGTSALMAFDIARNVPMVSEIALKESYYLTGIVMISDVGVQVPVAVVHGSARLAIQTAADGSIRALLPPGNHTVTGTTERVENGVTVRYTLSTPVALNFQDKSIDLPMTRDTRRAVVANWDKTLNQTALPGSPVEYVIYIKNTGNIADEYYLSYTGFEFAIEFTPYEIELDFGINNEGTVVAKVTPTYELVAGEAMGTISVRSRNSASARSDVNLYVTVAAVRDVDVTSLETSRPVSGRVSYTDFSVNNTGNIEDEYLLSVANADELALHGWSVEIVDASLAKTVNTTLDAFSSAQLMVKFTAIRSTPDPYAQAYVFASSKTMPGVSAYAAVSVILPDVTIGPGDLTAERDDVTDKYDIGALYLDIGLAVALVALLVTFFLLRRKKGLGGAKK